MEFKKTSIDKLLSKPIEIDRRAEDLANQAFELLRRVDHVAQIGLQERLNSIVKPQVDLALQTVLNEGGSGLERAHAEVLDDKITVFAYPSYPFNGKAGGLEDDVLARLARVLGTDANRLSRHVRIKVREPLPPLRDIERNLAELDDRSPDTSLNSNSPDQTR